MFIKKSWCTVKGKRYYTYQLAESYRPGKGKNPRTRILATITHWPKWLIDKLSILLKNPESLIITDLGSFFKESYIFGPILFLYLYMKRIGIIDSLKYIPKKSRIMLIGVILNRILDPRSKLGSVSWVKKTIFPYLFGVEKNKLVVSSIYKAMDKLYKGMEKVLEDFFIRNRRGTILLLYDITSIFFEGKGPKGLARNGFSRDGKPENVQILLSLVINEERMPVWYEVLEGNIADKKTVIPLIKRLKERFNLRNSIFIGDRGMVSLENIEFLEREGIDYIIALTHRKARELVFKEGIQMEIFDKRVPVTIYEEEEEGKKRKYILCGSEYRRERDRKVLEHILKKGRESLEVVEKMVKGGRIKDREKIIRRAQKKLVEAKAEVFYDFKYEGGRFEIIEKEEIIEKAKALCGYYILQTTVEDMSEEEIEERYKELKFVEDVFRQLKNIAEIRPIFHWKERRVLTHIFLCILAQTTINKAMEKLKEAGWLQGEKTFSHFRDILEEINLGIFEIEGGRAEVVTQLKKEQRELIEIFGMDEKVFTNFSKAKKVVD